MNSAHQNIWRSHESQCLPSTSQSYPEFEIVPSNPTYHERFRYFQESSQRCNESSKQQSHQSRTFSQMQDDIHVNSDQFNLPQPKVKNLDSASQNQGYSKILSHENGNFSDYGVSNPQSSFDGSRTLDLSESQLLEMQQLAGSGAYAIPQIHEWRSSYQEHPQELVKPTNAPMHPEYRQINNIEKAFHTRPRHENRNRNISVFSNQSSENVHRFGQQYLQDYPIEHSTQQHTCNQHISEEVHENSNNQAGMPGIADPRNSAQICTSYRFQDNQLSTSPFDGNLFQEFHGENSLLANRCINSSSFPNPYLRNDHPPLNQQCLQGNEPVQPPKVYYDPRMNFVDDPETFKAQTCPPKLPDQRHSEYTQSYGNIHFNQKSSTYTGRNLVLGLPNSGSSYMEMNPHEAQQSASNTLKNGNFRFNNDIHWDESRISGESNAAFLTRGHLEQETVSTATISEEQKRHKLDTFPSCATSSGELMHAKSAVSAHHKNSATLSKPLCLESNIIPLSIQQLEKWSDSYVFTSANLYQNFTSHSKDAKILQCLRNSTRGNSFFPRNPNLIHNYQTETRNEQSFADSQYSSSYTTEQYIKIHPKEHSKEKPFQCKMCGKFFKQKGEIVQHIRTHTSERPYRCYFCPKSFKQRGALKNHIQTHENKRQYKCAICPKRFNLKGDLKLHIRTHTKERPYPCTSCPKSFKQSSQLSVHIRSHTNEKAICLRYLS